MDRQGMDMLDGELANTGKEFIPKMPEMLLGLYCSSNSIKGKLGHSLTPHSNGPIVDEGLESLLIFTLKHHLQLLSAHVPVISLISTNVKGFQVLKGPGLEDFLVL